MPKYVIPPRPKEDLVTLGMVDPHKLDEFLKGQTNEDLEHYRNWYVAKVFSKRIVGNKSHFIEGLHAKVVQEINRRSKNHDT